MKLHSKLSSLRDEEEDQPEGSRDIKYKAREAASQTKTAGDDCKLWCDAGQELKQPTNLISLLLIIRELKEGRDKMICLDISHSVFVLQNEDSGSGCNCNVS